MAGDRCWHGHSPACQHPQLDDVPGSRDNYQQHAQTAAGAEIVLLEPLPALPDFVDIDSSTCGSMSPVLAASTDTALSPGAHRFRLRWVVPAELCPGTGCRVTAAMMAPAGACET